MPLLCFSQSTLDAGDLIFVTVNADSPGSFEFVPLKEVEAGTIIYFTDNAWVRSINSLNAEEGMITYNAPETIPAGKTVSYTGTDGNGFTASGGDFRLSSRGDNMIAYQVSGDQTRFIYGIRWGSSSSDWIFKSGRNSYRSSDMPPGLSEARHTIANLKKGHNFQYDLSKGTEGTPYTFRQQAADPGNWKSNNRKIFPTLDTGLTFVNAPVLRFTGTDFSINEQEGTATINVELAESNGTAVSVEVAFVSALSTIDASDIQDYETQTVQFNADDGSGTTKKVTITLSDDEEYEGKETALFRLENPSKGTVVEPALTNLTIFDDDVPKVIINEVLVDPHSGKTGDASGDGTGNPEEDVFVEMVNNESSSIDISGWKIFNSDALRYTFSEGTLVPAKSAVVVFGGGRPAGYFGSAIVKSSAALKLDKSAGTVMLKDNEDNEIDRFVYNNAGNTSMGSLTRRPENRDRLRAHSSISGTGGALFSPGTNPDGSAFGSKYATRIRGGEGWQMLSSPTRATTFKDLFGKFRIQGIAGSNAPGDEATIYYWDESEGGGTFVRPGDMSEEIVAGQGYAVYFFGDNDSSVPGVDGELPTVVNTGKPENNNTVTVGVTSTDFNGDGVLNESEGWNLLGNPFGTYLSVDEIIKLFNNVEPGFEINENVLVWDHSSGGGNGGYRILTGDERIAPFQSFWIRFESVGLDASVIFDKKSLSGLRSGSMNDDLDETVFSFDLTVNNGRYSDSYYLEFTEGGDVEVNSEEAYKLNSLNPRSINLYSLSGNKKIMKNVLPAKLNTALEIPLSIETSREGTFRFSWKGLDQLPEDWQVTIRDTETERETDLATETEYKFVEKPARQEEQAGKDQPLMNRIHTESKSPRFILSIRPSQNMNNKAATLPESVKLNPNYPNPFNNITTIPYELSDRTDVELSIWNIVGQQVAILVDEVREAGTHDPVWNANDMPSGIYIAKLEVDGEVYTRKITLIK